MHFQQEFGLAQKWREPRVQCIVLGISWYEYVSSPALLSSVTGGSDVGQLSLLSSHYAALCMGCLVDHSSEVFLICHHTFSPS